MSLKKLLGSIFIATVAGSASSSTGVSVSSSNHDAVISITGQGTFDAILKVTPAATNGLLLSFSSLDGSYSNVKYSFFSNSALSSSIGQAAGYTIKTGPSGASSTFTVGTNLIPFNDAAKPAFDLLGGTPYFVKLSGTLNDPDGSGQLLVSSNGTVANGTAVAAVPEPGTYAMLLAGLGMMGAIVRRRRSQH